MMSREEKSNKLLKEMKKDEKRKKVHKVIKILLIIFFLIITFVFLLFIYMRFVATSNLIVKEYKVLNNNLPDSYNGLKIVHFTDLHYNSTVDKASLTSIVKKINNLKPDIVVFTGDLVSESDYLTDEDITDLISAFNDIECTISKYVIRGNHDYHHDYFNKVFDQTNFIFLDNSYDLIYYKSNDPILINGLGSKIKGDTNIDKAFEIKQQANYFTITLIHEPDTIDDILNSYDIDLCLSGHSHNGQIRLPFLGALGTIKGAKKYDDPYYRVNNTDLYISGGIGTSSYKLRFFNRPSINFYRLTK